MFEGELSRVKLFVPCAMVHRLCCLASLFFTLDASSGKRTVTVWRLSVCLSLCLSLCLFVCVFRLHT